MINQCNGDIRRSEEERPNEWPDYFKELLIWLAVVQEM